MTNPDGTISCAFCANLIAKKVVANVDPKQDNDHSIFVFISCPFCGAEVVHSQFVEGEAKKKAREERMKMKQECDEYFPANPPIVRLEKLEPERGFMFMPIDKQIEMRKKIKEIAEEYGFSMYGASWQMTERCVHNTLCHPSAISETNEIGQLVEVSEFNVLYVKKR